MIFRNVYVVVIDKVVCAVGYADFSIIAMSLSSGLAIIIIIDTESHVTQLSLTHLWTI